MRRAAAGLALLLLAAPGGVAGDIPDAKVIFEAFEPALPTHVPEAAPPRFVLLEDGQVFVGGTSSVLTGVPDKRTLKELDKRLDKVRKLRGLGAQVTLGSGPGRYRLLLRKGRPIDMTISGDPEQAPASLRPLAELIEELSAFYHWSLKEYRAASVLVRARPGPAVGGCRPWTLADSPDSASFTPLIVPADAVGAWPRGAAPAFACSGGKSYVVTFRPLLPGEQP